jgi:hypothetical protein
LTTDPPDETQTFAALQARLAPLFRDVFPDRLAQRTVVVLPSLSLDSDVLAKVTAAHHYEERMLGMLMLLRLPRTRVIYLTSAPIPEPVVDYYLQLLPGVPASHARARLTLISCHDRSATPLTQKILDRPRLIAALQHAIGDPALAHLSAFAVTPLERKLAVRLGVPIYGCDPALAHLGSKSGGRALMREAGVDIPDGEENLRDVADIAQALTALKRRQPQLKRALVKINEGFSGDGNAVFGFHGAPERSDLGPWAKARLPHMKFEAAGMTYDAFAAKARDMGAVVEAFVEGEEKTSPSAQFRIDPLGRATPISTHDQVLGGPNGGVFLGARFPADAAYRLDIQADGERIAQKLAEAGALGRFGVDFVCVREGDAWRRYAIEINLRKGGTTHPFLMLEFLTGGRYDAATGLFHTPSGHARYYTASDNLQSERYRGLTPADLVDIAVEQELHYDGASQEGVVFHLIGALSEFGKLGLVCVGASPERAEALYRRAVEILDGAQDQPNAG